MSDGSDGSGGGGGVRGDGGAHDVGPQEPQTLGSRVDRTPALSPDLAVQWVKGAAAGSGTEGTAAFSLGKWPLGFLPLHVCCGCIAKGAGGGQMIGLGGVSGRHPAPHAPLCCRCATQFAEVGGSHGI